MKSSLRFLSPRGASAATAQTQPARAAQRAEPMELKVMALKILQANVNHCVRVQDLLAQSMAQWLIDVTVVAEPYFVPPRDNWVADRDGMVAIVSSASSSPPMSVVRGHGAVSARLGELVVVGVYFSSNRPHSEFEALLVEVEAFVHRSHPLPMLVVGCLNAKSSILLRVLDHFVV